MNLTSFPETELSDAREAGAKAAALPETGALFLETAGPPAVGLREQSPLGLAFLGDSVLELLVRRRLVSSTRLQPGALHARAAVMVSARGQAAALSAMEPIFTQEEQDWLRKGRNSSKATVAKHASPEEYRASTALESLFGRLYLLGRQARIVELFEAFWNSFSKA